MQTRKRRHKEFLRQKWLQQAAAPALGMSMAAAMVAMTAGEFINPVTQPAQIAKLQQVGKDLRTLMAKRGYDHNLKDFRPFPNLLDEGASSDMMSRISDAMTASMGANMPNGGGYIPAVNGRPQSLAGASNSMLRMISSKSGIAPDIAALLITGHEAGHMWDINNNRPRQVTDANQQEAFGDIAGLYLVARFEGKSVALDTARKWQSFREARRERDACHDTAAVIAQAVESMSKPGWQAAQTTEAAYVAAETDFSGYYRAANQRSIASACRSTAYGKPKVTVKFTP